MITQEDITIIHSQDEDTLAAWWAMLNDWEWPDSLPDPAPAHHVPARGRDRRGQIMELIRMRVRAKDLAMAHSKRRKGTEFDLGRFNQWWTLYGSKGWGDTEAITELGPVQSVTHHPS